MHMVIALIFHSCAPIFLQTFLLLSKGWDNYNRADYFRDYDWLVALHCDVYVYKNTISFPPVMRDMMEYCHKKYDMELRI